MTLPILPVFAGVDYDTHKIPTFSTLRVDHVSGRRVVCEQWSLPIWEFDLAIEVLSDSAMPSAVGAQSYQSMLAFFLEVQSQAGTFLYQDPTDFQVTGGTVGTGNGSTTVFIFTRAIGSFVEPVGSVASSSVTIWINGTQQNPTTYSVSGNQVTFTSAPAFGAAITATFSFYFVCEFVGDKMDFSNLMFSYWSLNSLKFRSVKSPT